MRVFRSGSIVGVIALTVLQSAAFAQNTFDRSKPPELGPPPRVALPPIVTRELPNGLKLMIVEQHELPLADFVLLVGSGSTTNPLAKTGVANLTAAMLREGTTTRKSLEIADQIAFLGIGLNSSSSWESSTISLHTPIAQLDSGLALFADVALHPSFPANEFEEESTYGSHSTEGPGTSDRQSRLPGNYLWKRASIRSSDSWNGNLGQITLCRRPSELLPDKLQAE